MKETDKIKLLLVDDHTIFLEGIVELLRKEKHIEIVGTACSGKEAIEVLNKVKCDLLMTDVSMDEMGGLELTKLVNDKFSDVKVLVMSMHRDVNQIRSLLDAGASGYVLKNSTKQELIDAIESTHQHGGYFTNHVKDILLNNLLQKSTSSQDTLLPKIHLTKREKEVLNMVTKEMTNLEISEKLFLSIHTVETHRRNLMKKMGVNSGIGLTRKAFEMGLVTD